MTSDGFFGVRGENEYPIKDDKDILEFYYAHKDDDADTLAKAVCSNVHFWGEDLSAVPGFEADVAAYLKAIETQGAYEVMKSCL